MTSQTMGRYQIFGELGRGGMATVYLAYDAQLAREVALKVLPRELLHEPEFRARFRREVDAVVALEHPAIVPVYEAGEHEGQPFMVMRHMGGGTLAARIGRGPLPLAQAARIIGPLASALDAAHSVGLVHRDVKPENVLFDLEDRPYLADFGIVALREATTKLTGSGFVGTPDYMAPELTRPGGLTPLVDVYALGVLLFQMLTARLPYEADTPLGTLVAHVTEPIPDLCRLRPDLPPAAQVVLARALAKDPAERHPSAGDLAADLVALAAGEAPPTLRLAGARSRRVVPAPERRRGLRAVVTAVFAALVGALVIVGALALLGPRVGGFPGLAERAVPPGAAAYAPTIPPIPLPPPTPRPLPPTITAGTTLQMIAGPVSTLPGDIIGARYSAALDRLLTLARGQNQLVIYQLPGWEQRSIALPSAGISLSLSPDGLHAAVGHQGSVSYIDLQAEAIQAQLQVSGDAGELALTNDGRIFVAPGPTQSWDQAREGDVRLLVAETGAEIATGFRATNFTDLELSPDGLSLLLAADGHLSAYGLDWGGYLVPLGASGDNAAVCDRFWPTPDSRQAIMSCGHVFTTEPDANGMLQYVSDLAKLTSITTVAHAPAAGQLLVAAGPPTASQAEGPDAPVQDRLYVYDAHDLHYVSEISLPWYEAGPERLPIEARHVFVNSAGSAYYVLVYIPKLRSFGVTTLSLSPLQELSPVSRAITPLEVL